MMRSTRLLLLLLLAGFLTQNRQLPSSRSFCDPFKSNSATGTERDRGQRDDVSDRALERLIAPFRRRGRLPPVQLAPEIALEVARQRGRTTPRTRTKPI